MKKIYWLFLPATICAVFVSAQQFDSRPPVQPFGQPSFSSTGGTSGNVTNVPGITNANQYVFSNAGHWTNGFIQTSLQLLYADQSQHIVIDNSGNFTHSGRTRFRPKLPEQVPFVVSELNTGTTNLQEWQDSDNNILSRVARDGTFNLRALVVTNESDLLGATNYSAGDFGVDGTIYVSGGIHAEGNLVINNSISFDGGLITSDGSGNLTLFDSLFLGSISGGAQIFAGPQAGTAQRIMQFNQTGGFAIGDVLGNTEISFQDDGDSSLKTKTGNYIFHALDTGDLEIRNYLGMLGSDWTSNGNILQIYSYDNAGINTTIRFDLDQNKIEFRDGYGLTLGYFSTNSTTSDTSGNQQWKGILSGNGSGLTNITANAPSLVRTNFISGLVYLNNTGRPIQVSALACLTGVGVVGQVNLALRISNSVTNDIGATTLLTSIATISTNAIEGFVPNGETYTFTNTSTGAGNSATVGKGQYIIY